MLLQKPAPLGTAFGSAFFTGSADRTYRGSFSSARRTAIAAMSGYATRLLFIKVCEGLALASQFVPQQCDAEQPSSAESRMS